MTRQRRIIATAIDTNSGHPDINDLFAEVQQLAPSISLATVYRTVKFFEDHDVIQRNSFGRGRMHYERSDAPHHDHLIDIDSGEIIEFQSSEIEELQRQIAAQLGYQLVDHHLRLYGRSKAKK